MVGLPMSVLKDSENYSFVSPWKHEGPLQLKMIISMHKVDLLKNERSSSERLNNYYFSGYGITKSN